SLRISAASAPGVYPDPLGRYLYSLTLSLFHSLTLSYLCDLCVLPSVNSVLPSLFLFSANLCVRRLPRPGRRVIFSFSELFNLFYSCLLIVDNLQHRCAHQLRYANLVSLFSPPRGPDDDTPAALQPLAERMRPRTLDEFIGQEKLLGPGKPLRLQIESDNLSSMLLWGPPGCGKTTLARVIARLTRSEFISFSAVLSGIKEIKEVMAQAERKSHSSQRTIVFVDEVHRFNKAQQDAFLPHV